MAELTIQQAFDLALQHHQAGRLQEAQGIYRQILAVQPQHAGALHFLGVMAHQSGQHDMAVDLIRQAIALAPKWPEAHHNLANILKTSGRLDEAIAAYRQALALQPNWPEAHNSMGVALKVQGRLDEAIAVYRQAIALKPDWAEVHSNIGNALRDKGDLDEAIAAYRQAIALKPDLFATHSNLGVALHAKGQLDEAIAAYGQALALNPMFAEAHNNLGNALQAKGRLDEASAAYRQTLSLNPNFPEAHNSLGNVLKDMGLWDEAIAAFRHAVSLKPDYAEAHNNLGVALKLQGHLDQAVASCRQAVALNPTHVAAYSNLGNALQAQGQLDEAIAAYRQAIVLKPNHSGAHNNLGVGLQAQGQLDEAVSAYRHAVALKPDYAEAHNNLGTALKDQGQLDEAIAAYRQALALKPDYPEAHSNLVLSLHYHPEFDASALAQEHRRWDQQHAEPLKAQIKAHSNERNPERRLRIGYVSPDLCEHVVGQFLLPLLANHDRQLVEIFAYAQVPVADAMTQRLRSHTDAWRSLVGLSDAQAADLIRQDGIDILVDLAMHTSGNRLLVFARKPAPVQVTYLAYAGSSGLSTMDYRLSDPYLDRLGGDESLYSEQTIRLPETYWCYRPAVALPLQPPPAMENGFVTFGCLNNFCKVNETLLSLWVRLLGVVPDSRLLLHAHEGSHRQRVLEQLQRAGVEPQRVRFAGKVSIAPYFQLYQSIDIALDTFPYGGGTTSCDALWMGVPVVSLVGQTAVGRAGLSILSNVGLPELAANTPEAYVRIAADLANDLRRLQATRSTLRQRMEASALMDAPKFARGIEEAYRQMWRTWTAARG